MGTFIENVENILNYHLKGKQTEGLFGDSLILRKPIGIGTKSYGFMEAMLHRNIGSHNFNYDGFGTTIGMGANPYLNSTVDPWFILDESKQKYDNYLSYMNDMYFHGTMLPPNFQSSDNKTVFNDYNGMLSEISRVGVIHHYDIENNSGARLFIPDGSTNPNGYEDTRLGVINNFYLHASLRNSQDNMELRGTSSYHKPSYGREDAIIKNSYSVTQGAYSKFGLKGEYGIKNGTFSLKEGAVTPTNLYTDEIIVWSTTDNNFTSNGDNARMGNILGIEGDMANSHKDNVRNGGYVTYPFGNFYSLSYSLGLLSASGDKTKEMIAKSIYGIDLLSDIVPSLEFDGSNVDNLKKISRKKYFAIVGSRGTNYIDAMTGIDVSKKQDASNNIIRLEFNDPGNDNYLTFNSYLFYAEAEGNKNAVEFSSLKVGNEGTSVKYYQTYDDKILNKEDIISYTNQQFKKNKFKTIIGKFHTDSYDNANDARAKRDMTSSSVSQYGMSHGRNLLSRDHQNTTTNGFHDPYCRVWTYHKQYSKYSDLIRPLNADLTIPLNTTLERAFQKNRPRLNKYGAKFEENGLMRIAPSKDEKDIRNCMFSIENLAWKGSDLLKEYHKGPNGGRIMWFPPYGLTFQESSKVNWNATQFIGRGEKIFSYVDTERSGSLSFEMLIDHPSILNYMNNTADTIGDVDDVNSLEQTILRFFAGCDILNSSSTSEESNNNDDIIEDEVPITHNSTIENFTIEFDIYFPHGYSGVEGGVNWVEYLINGIGVDYEKKDFYSDEKMKNLIGGYEMDGAKGLSCVSKWEKYPPAEVGGKFLITKDVFYKGWQNQAETKNVYAIKINESSTNVPPKPIYWGFLTDSKYSRIDVFDNENATLDNDSYHLNTKVKRKERQNNEEGLKVSFGDFAVFMNSDCCTENKKKKISSEENQKLLKSLFDEYKVHKIKIDGYTLLNIRDGELGKTRASQVAKWLKKNNKLNDDEIYETNGHLVEKYDKYVTRPNSKSAKQKRKVSVVITLQKEIIDLDMNYHDSKNDTIIQEAKNKYKNSDYSINSLQLMSLLNVKENDTKTLLIDEIITQNRRKSYVPINNNKYDESTFFNTISATDNVLRNKIVDKIKYFDPAFHSITPEGFNSRLTFLHQCTRQGATNSVREVGSNTRNLSFGKPPICVLRIGDFFNTKIVIDTVNIHYDETQWDLNDEGIGIMPMSAKIDISFNFIGGSELGNAVDILQNAVSFNYYANTSVYDDNAVKIDINNNNGDANAVQGEENL